MIRERCSCGATFETDDSFAVNGTPDWASRGERMAADFRRDHRCVAPVTALAEIHDSGPGLADVIERLESIAERMEFIEGITP